RQQLDVDEPSSFEAAAATMARAVERAELPVETRTELRAAWAAAGPGASAPKWRRDRWIVRSSAVGEDSDADSFAGQLDSVLDVCSVEQLEQAVRRCWASFWSARALFYQQVRGRRLQGMGVIVERM